MTRENVTAPSGEETMTRREELMACPFCGPGQSMVDLWHDDVSKRWAVGCGRCGASSGRSVHAEGSKESARKSWNTRASPSTGGEQVVVKPDFWFARHPLRHRCETFYRTEDEARQDCLGAVDQNYKPVRYYPLYRATPPSGFEAGLKAAELLVRKMQERITETERGTERSLSPRMAGNLMGIAFADAIPAIPIPPQGEVTVKPLEWRDHRPDSFPEPAWSAQTPFGFYNIEEVSASDSPAYVVRLHAHHFIGDKDSLDEAKEAAQADYEQRIRSALLATHVITKRGE